MKTRKTNNNKVCYDKLCVYGIPNKVRIPLAVAVIAYGIYKITR